MPDYSEGTRMAILGEYPVQNPVEPTYPEPPVPDVPLPKAQHKGIAEANNHFPEETSNTDGTLVLGMQSAAFVDAAQSLVDPDPGDEAPVPNPFPESAGSAYTRVGAMSPPSDISRPSGGHSDKEGDSHSDTEYFARAVRAFSVGAIKKAINSIAPSPTDSENGPPDTSASQGSCSSSEHGNTDSMDTDGSDLQEFFFERRNRRSLAPSPEGRVDRGSPLRRPRWYKSLGMFYIAPMKVVVKRTTADVPCDDDERKHSSKRRKCEGVWMPAVMEEEDWVPVLMEVEEVDENEEDEDWALVSLEEEPGGGGG